MAAASFDFSTAPANTKKQKREDGAAASGSTQDKSAGNGNRKQLDNLDYRTRVTEAAIFDSMRVPADKTGHDLWKTMMGAKAYYAGERPSVTGEHPLGPERWTLMMGALQVMTKATAAQWITQLSNMQKEIKDRDTIARTLNKPTIQQQVEALVHYAKNLPRNPESKEESLLYLQFWVAHFQFTGTKKKDAYLLKFGFKRDHVMTGCMPALRIIFRSCGATDFDGTAPANPHIHKGAKKETKIGE